MMINKKLLFNIILTIALILIMLSGIIILGSRSIVSKLFLEQSREQLSLIGNFKKQELENFFTTLQQQAKLIIQDQVVKEALQEFTSTFEQMVIVNPEEHHSNNLVMKLNYPNLELVKYYNNLSANYDEYFNNSNKIIDKPDFSNVLSTLDLRGIYLQTKYNVMGSTHPSIAEYVTVHDKYNEYLSKIVSEHNYNDMLLIDFNGNVVYSVKKNIDFAASMQTSSFLTAEIANLFNSLKYPDINENNHIISNFTEYFADYYEPIFFIASKLPNLGILIISVKISNIHNLLSLPKDLNKINIHLTDQDFRLIDPDNFGKIIDFSLLKANVTNTVPTLTSSLNFLKFSLDKSPSANINYFTKVKINNNSLNLLIESSKNIPLENLITPLITIFYFSCGFILVLFSLLYCIGWFNIEKTEKNLNKIKEFMKNIINKQDFNSRISMNSEEVPSNIADILNNMLIWFDQVLAKVVFKVKKFVAKYNSFLNSVTLISSQLDKERSFFSNAKNMMNQLEVVVFKIQHECQQYYNIFNEQKNAHLNLNSLYAQFNHKFDAVCLNDSLEYLFHVCNFTEMLCLQLPLEISKHSNFKNKKIITLFKKIKPMLSNLKLKLSQLKSSLNEYASKYNNMSNFINNFFEKSKPIEMNTHRLLEAQKTLLLISNDQLNNVNALQQELLNLELKYNNFNKQLLEIINNNSKLNVDLKVNDNDISKVSNNESDNEVCII